MPSEDRYRSIFENPVEGIYQSSPEGSFIAANATMAKILGYESSEDFLANLKDIDRQYYADPGYHNEFTRRLSMQGVIRDFEAWVLRKDGSTICISTDAWIVRDSNGRPLHYEGFVRDITEHKRAENALAQRAGIRIAGAIVNPQRSREREGVEESLLEREERYRNILENIEEGYFEVDLQGNFTFANDYLSKIIGFPQEKLMGMNNREYMDKETAKEIFAIFNQVYNTGRPGKVFEWKLTRKDGKVLFEECSVYLIRNAHGKRIGFRGIVRDITERKQMEEALRKSEERFRQVAENAGEWIWEVDANGLYTYSNLMVEKILGYKPEELEGKKYFYDFLDPEAREKIKEKAFKTFKNRGSVKRFISPNIHKNGDFVYLETNGTPVVDVQGNLVGYRGANTDISERKRAEEERENLIQELQDALAKIKILRGMLPICACCKKIRDDKGYWKQIESYIRDHSEAEFSHSICPECREKLYPGFQARNDKLEA